MLVNSVSSVNPASTAGEAVARSFYAADAVAAPADAQAAQPTQDPGSSIPQAQLKLVSETATSIPSEKRFPPSLQEALSAYIESLPSDLVQEIQRLANLEKAQGGNRIPADSSVQGYSS